VLCTIVLLIPDPVGAKNTEDSKALSLALSALQDLTDSTKEVSPMTGDNEFLYRYVIYMVPSERPWEKEMLRLPCVPRICAHKVTFVINLLQETDKGQVTVLQRVTDVVVNLLNIHEVSSQRTPLSERRYVSIILLDN